jgi:hypothetical protein
MYRFLLNQFMSGRYKDDCSFQKREVTAADPRAVVPKEKKKLNKKKQK